MSKGFSKLNIKSAVKSRSNIDLDHTHLTTMDFGQICLLNYFDGIPGDKVNYKYNIFSRIAPLNFPIYGNCSLRTVNFFVPYYQVADEIEGFFSGQKMYHGTSTSLRWTTLNDILLLFSTNSAVVPLCKDLGSNDDEFYDFVYIEPSGARRFLQLTSHGRFVYKVLRSFGYDFPAQVDMSQASFTEYLATKVNLLPLLAYFKAYNDWMTNSVHFNSSVMTSYMQAIRFKDTSVKIKGTSVCTSGGFIPYQALAVMFEQVRLLFDSDYFTSAWRYPNDPDESQSGIYAGVSSVDVLPYDVIPSGANFNGTGTVESSNMSVYSSTPGYTSNTELSARQLRFLMAFDNWVRRNNYAGTRAVNQIYARFGIKPTEFRSQYAELISKDSIPLRIGDVTQTSQTTTTLGNDNSQLGSYAGKGIVDGQHGVSYQFNDYGCLMTLVYIWVDPFYYSGFHKNILKTEPLDFYNPEFDGVGPEAISMLEVWNDPKELAKSGMNNNGNTVFGFTERYNDMRFQRDQITGDFALYDFMKAWHFGRDMSQIRNGKVSAQSDAVVYYTPTEKGDSEFDRIFAVQNTSDGVPIEHFYLTCQFSGSASRPIKNVSSAADLGDGNLVIDRLGQQVS